jgi:hypothetical protein
MLSSMRAIGYVRVSTDKQADHGVSLEAQEAKIPPDVPPGVTPVVDICDPRAREILIDCGRHGWPMPDNGRSPRTPSAWMISLALSLAQRQGVFFVWVSLSEQKWVILAERRSRR